eukprot:TRINITY_DN1160_c0_g1_i1.p1 TRINITY_DN1160_c0_g1~~TRINITY_DN1160_c0_g1_i1.p1  ORF type:complete len:256 (-),score=52.16 TRINITY_DN1160_c0_g1_i1:51-818(-)
MGGENYFTSLFRFSKDIMEEPTYFIDADPEAFELILRYLRTGSLQYDPQLKSLIYYYLNHFGILPPLETDLNAKHRSNLLSNGLYVSPDSKNLEYLHFDLSNNILNIYNKESTRSYVFRKANNLISLEIDGENPYNLTIAVSNNQIFCSKGAEPVKYDFVQSRAPTISSQYFCGETGMFLNYGINRLTICPNGRFEVEDCGPLDVEFYSTCDDDHLHYLDITSPMMCKFICLDGFLIEVSVDQDEKILNLYNELK